MKFRCAHRLTLLTPETFEGDTLIHMAARSGASVKYLTEAISPDYFQDLLITCKIDGQTPIHTAAAKPTASTLKGRLCMLSAEQIMPSLDMRDSNGDNAFHIAARGCGLEVIKFLCSGTLNEDELQCLLLILNKQKLAPLHLAADCAPFAVEDILLPFSAQQLTDLLHVQTIEGNTTKHILSMKCGGDKAIQNLATMLSANDLYDVLLCADAHGFTAVHLAAGHNNTEVLKKILIGLSNKQRIVLLNTKTREGNTVMHIVARGTEVDKMGHFIVHVFGGTGLDSLLLTLNSQELTPIQVAAGNS